MYAYVCVYVSLQMRSILLFGVLVCTWDMCGRYMYVYVKYSFIQIGGGMSWGGMDGLDGSGRSCSV